MFCFLQLAIALIGIVEVTLEKLSQFDKTTNFVNERIEADLANNIGQQKYGKIIKNVIRNSRAR